MKKILCIFIALIVILSVLGRKSKKYNNTVSSISNNTATANTPKQSTTLKAKKLSLTQPSFKKSNKTKRNAKINKKIRDALRNAAKYVELLTKKERMIISKNYCKQSNKGKNQGGEAGRAPMR